MADNQPTASTMTTKQKVTILAFVLVMIFLIWQIWAMFAGSSSDEMRMANNNLTPAQRSVPQSAPLAARATQPTPREMEMMKQQEVIEAKYLSAIQELQMLKIQKDIAETNKAIASAKLETVTSQTKAVDLLTQPTLTPSAYAPTLVNPVSSGMTLPVNTANADSNAAPRSVSTQTPYSVISVSKLRAKWNAVLGNQSNLYHVAIGDVLPPDESKVISIDNTGVTLEKNGERRKISLVPII